MHYLDICIQNRASQGGWYWRICHPGRDWLTPPQEGREHRLVQMWKSSPDHCQNLWILTWIKTKESTRSSVRLLTQTRSLGAERGKRAEGRVKQRWETLSGASFMCGQRRSREWGWSPRERHQVRRRAGWLHFLSESWHHWIYIYIERFYFLFPLIICIFPPISHKDKASGVLHVISKYVLSLYCVLTGWCPEGYKDVENRACALKKQGKVGNKGHNKWSSKWEVNVETQQS